MEEEVNENELEEQFYSMLHYVDDSQANVTTDQNVANILEKVPRSTVRRYWRTSGERPATAPVNTPFQKINIPAEAPKPTNNSKTYKTNTSDDTKPKEEKCSSPDQLPKHLSLFQSPIPPNMKKTIEIIDTEDKVVELESSDEDEVIEVALPPKPTITIESSDDEITIQTTPIKTKPQDKRSGERAISASPVPSIVSSVSDDFIRGDCIALNISSRHPDHQSFDFSLHGPDLLEGSPAKRKKKKKKKSNSTSTPVTIDFSEPKSPAFDECFATPKSKAKNIKKKKSYAVTETSIPSVDVYDSDSNQSVIELNRKQNSYVVTEKTLPSADIYETDSNPPEAPIAVAVPTQNNDVSSDSSISLDNPERTIEITKDSTPQISIDLTESSALYDDDDGDIQESIVMGNVTGFAEPDYDDDPIINTSHKVQKFGSTKVPAILYENLDFDNLKGKEKVCKNRRYSLTTLRAEMEKFYNESWGGEDFNHREIQKNMSRDKSLWAIDPKDRMTSFSRKKYSVTCNYCNRTGHRDDTCRLKPPVCYMCGNTGHVEPRCPRKICVNCGSPNYMYSTMCRNCAGWRQLACGECGQRGHPASHCPDLWRRYHNTIEITSQLEQNRFMKNRHQLFCSGCTRRGHLIHTCRLTLPFSGLAINSPFVCVYRPVYEPENPDTQQDSTISSATIPQSTPKPDRNKRQSKSPTAHETHVNKKRHVSLSENADRRNTKNPLLPNQEPQSKTPQSKETESTEANTQAGANAGSEQPEKAPDFIPIFSNNHDKKGLVIQDNEVSDTSDVVTSARIYITNEVADKLRTKEGEEWLKLTTEKFTVTIENAEVNSAPFLNIKGKLGDQEAFQTALRDWSKDKPNTEENKPNNGTEVSQSLTNLVYNIPKNRNNVLRQVSKALESLKNDIGEPEQLFKELGFLRMNHRKLLNQKVVSPKQLDNNRGNINAVLKKLNMVLLGQAGLADGFGHLQKLYELQAKLINFRQKNIPTELRQEIGAHYHSIFTDIPRNDYGQLVEQYKCKCVGIKKNKKRKLNNKTKNSNAIPILNQPTQTDNVVKTGQKAAKKRSRNLQNKTDFEKRKIIFYQKRLLKSQPHDMVLKKTRSELVRKSYRLMGSFKKSSPKDVENAPKSKAQLKEFRKFRKHAELFLKNV